MFLMLPNIPIFPKFLKLPKFHDGIGQVLVGTVYSKILYTVAKVVFPTDLLLSKLQSKFNEI